MPSGETAMHDGTYKNTINLTKQAFIVLMVVYYASDFLVPGKCPSPREQKNQQLLILMGSDIQILSVGGQTKSVNKLYTGTGKR